MEISVARYQYYFLLTVCYTFLIILVLTKCPNHYFLFILSTHLLYSVTIFWGETTC